ncbi:hypothetical protein GCM10023189_53430 [Nibrella saemangeumensis]|uniref:Rhodanese domain-containing protein n=1 Tax=Nibrella saemangeumensis TaxID=1084526 RepID=A0ABP8NND1_9BACT
MKALILMTLVGLSMAANGQTTSSAYKVMLETLYKKSVPLITVEELRQKSGVILLDTRSRNEYMVSHLPGARWVGYDDFDLQRLASIPKSAEIVLYCSVGVRSERVGEKLQAAGYTNVKNLYGSLFEWVNQGNPVVDKRGQPTRRVHAYSRLWSVWLNRGDKVYD